MNNRKIYQKHCLPWRIDHLHSRIDAYQPKLVVFCGASYFQYWQAIAGKDLLLQDKKGFWAAQSKGILYLIVKHPAARGITNAYFEAVGSFVRANQKF